MNYTENYHLPQWVKDDRIMMEDFNAAMANLENGLTENAQTAETARDHGGALEDKTFRQLCRAAYNHLRVLWDAAPTPRQWGVFREKTPSMVPWYLSQPKQEEFTPVGRWSTPPDNDGFFQTLEQISAMRIVQGDASAAEPLLVNFTPAGGGAISRLAIQGTYNSNLPVAPTPYRLICTNLDTGKVEYQMSGDFGFNFNSGTPNVQLPVEILFHSGQHYQLKMEGLFSHANVGFSLTSTPAFQPVFFQTASASRTHTFQEDEDGEGGTFLVCCGRYGAGGTISLTLNGEELPVTLTRTCWDKRNALVEERIYRKPEHIPGGSVLKLTLTANPGGDLALHGWGAALL